MPNVTLSFADEPELKNKGMVLTVKDDDDIVGHLMIGKASIIWFKKNAKKRGYKVDWEELKTWFEAKEKIEATRP